MIIRYLCILALSVVTIFCEAQTVVVADATTHLPVTHASLYTRTNGKFHSAVTDANGKATVDFAFPRITISHLNYKPKRLRVLPDTVFLEPKEYLVSEVKVTNRESELIRRKLKAFVKAKDSAYYHDTGNGFTNIESTLRLASADSVLASNDTIMNGMTEAAKGDTTQLWIRLPESWYMRFSSDLDRRKEVRLAHLPCVWRRPEEM